MQDYSTTLAGGSVTPGTLTVTPALLTITANHQTSVSGSALPTLTASYAGFVNGDTSASLATAPTISTTATQNSPAGNLSDYRRRRGRPQLLDQLRPGQSDRHRAPDRGVVTRRRRRDRHLWRDHNLHGHPDLRRHPVANEFIDFHLGGTDLGTAITDANGVAIIHAASLAAINAGTYTGDVTASFAGDASLRGLERRRRPDRHRRPR